MELLKKMFYVYVLRSLSDGSRYVGSTKNIKGRLSEHNRGKQQYTKGKMPWELLYSEEFETNTEARKRELFFKTTTGRRKLSLILSGLEK